VTQQERVKFRTKELAIILSHYDLGEIREIHSFRRGNIHSPKSIINCVKGKYLLKRHGGGRDNAQQTQLKMELHQFLEKKGFCLPRLVPTRRGDTGVVEMEGNIYELFDYVEGDSYDGSVEATAAAGRCLRELHEMLADFRPSLSLSEQTYHNSEAVRRGLKRIFPGISKHDSVMGMEPQLQVLRAELSDAYNEAAERAEQAGYSQLNSAIGHGDWHPGNMSFLNGKITGVFDFDTIKKMPVYGDVANGCLQFSLIAVGKDPVNWPDHMDTERARFFLRAYEPETRWERKSLELIVSLMIEAMIAEAIGPIVATGMFAHIPGFRFLRMIARKIAWLEENGVVQLEKEG